MIKGTGNGGFDLVRPGNNSEVNNWGTIIAAAGSAGAGDAIKLTDDARGLINNYEGGWIEGSRHAVTGQLGITVLNEGTMIGRNGSAVNMDTDASDPVTVINRGTMEGRSAELADSDGDAVDVDGTLILDNYGRTQALAPRVITTANRTFPKASRSAAARSATMLAARSMAMAAASRSTIPATMTRLAGRSSSMPG